MSADLRLLWESAGLSVPEHWEFKTINDLLEHPKAISVGVMYPGSHVEDGVPLIKVSDVKNGAIACKPDFCIADTVDDEYKRSRLNGTELLITLVGNPGDCVVVNHDMAGWNAARALAVVRLKDIELREWLRYVLLSKPAKHLIESRLNTTVQKTLNLKDIRELGIPLPPDHERDLITGVVNSIEDKMLLNRQTNQTLEQIAQTLFKSWFVDFEPTHAKIAAKQMGQDPERAAMAAISGKTVAELDQLDAAQLAQLKKMAALFPDAVIESELGEVPEGWEAGVLANLCKLNEKSWNKKSQPEEVWYVDLANTKHGVVEEVHHFLWDDAPSRAKRVLQLGDTIIGTVRPGNRSFSFIGKTNDTLTASTGFAVLTPLRPSLSEFVYLAATSDENIDRLAHLADGGAYPAVKPDVVVSLDIAIPTDELIDNFSFHVKSLFEARSRNLISEANLKELRDTILPKLLSGELSPTQAEVA